MFTEEQKKEILDYSKTHSMKDTAKAFHISTYAIYKWKHENDKAFNEKQENQLIKLYEDNNNLTYKEAAAFFQVSKKVIKAAADRLKLNLKTKLYTDSDIRHVVQYLNKNPKAKEKAISKALNLSSFTIQSILKKVNMETNHSRLDKEAVINYINNNPKATYKQISAAFHCSLQTISNFIYNNNIFYIPKTKKDYISDKRKNDIKTVEAIITENEFVTLKSIAEQTGFSIMKAYSITKQIGHKKKYPRSISKDNLLAALPNFKNQSSLAKHFNVSQPTICRLLNVYNIDYKKYKK